MKRLQRIMLTLCMAFLFMAAFSYRTDAAANKKESIINLKTEVTYTKYDVTGDQKADKILIQKTEKVDEYYYGGLSIFINDKLAYRFKNNDYSMVEAKLCTLKNGAPYLYLYTPCDDYAGRTCGIYRYQNGKLLRKVNFQTLYKDGSHQYGDVTSIKGNTIKTKSYVMSWIMGPMNYSYSYQYDKGNLVRTSKIGMVKVETEKYEKNGYYTTKQNLNLYRYAASTKRMAVLKKGTKVKITKCYVNGKTIRIYVTSTSGKQKGWIVSPKDGSSGNGYFMESFYAG